MGLPESRGVRVRRTVPSESAVLQTRAAGARPQAAAGAALRLTGKPAATVTAGDRVNETCGGPWPGGPPPRDAARLQPSSAAEPPAPGAALVFQLLRAADAAAALAQMVD